jgi:hypothetical protein
MNKENKEENIKLKIENQVIKKQLVYVRDLIDNILADYAELELLKRNADIKEVVKCWNEMEKDLNKGKKVSVVKKDGKYLLEKTEIKKCVNCREELSADHESSFCSKCDNLESINK